MLCRECVLFTVCLSKETITGPLERVRTIQSGVEILQKKAFFSHLKFGTLESLRVRRCLIQSESPPPPSSEHNYSITWVLSA